MEPDIDAETPSTSDDLVSVELDLVESGEAVYPESSHPMRIASEVGWQAESVIPDLLSSTSCLNQCEETYYFHLNPLLAHFSTGL